MLTTTEFHGESAKTAGAADQNAPAVPSRLSHRNTRRKRLVQLTDSSAMLELRQHLPELLASPGVLEAEVRAADETVWVHYDLQHTNLAQIECWLTSHGARLPQIRSAQRIREAIHRVEAREQATFEREALHAFVPLR